MKKPQPYAMAGATPLATSRDLDPLIDRIGNAKLVLLGEASHGTHEYYTWRTAITARLIEEKGFGFVAVEGDWPDCYRVNRHVKNVADAESKPDDALRCFARWPTWMWANWEVAALLEWMRSWNAKRTKKKTGFYGLDVYSLWESMEALVNYLGVHDPKSLPLAEKALDCFTAAGRDEQRYAVRSLSSPCREEVVSLLKEIRTRAVSYNHDPEAALNATQNAHVAVEAEKYYRNMVAFDEETWNIRDRHMMETLQRLLDFHGASAKAVVWAHNTHVGDARYTDMARHGMFNIGQLARERFPGDQSVIVGFGSYEGAVMAGETWGSPMKEMDVPPGTEGSFEQRLHRESDHNRLIIFDQHLQPALFDEVVPHRAIGVVYNPARERGNYVPSLMGKRYDAFIYIDRSRAVHPLHVSPDRSSVPETYPFSF